MKIILEFDDKSINKAQTALQRGLKRFFNDPNAAMLIMRLAKELDAKHTRKKRDKKKATRKHPSKVAKSDRTR